MGFEVRAGDMGQRDTAARQPDVAAAHLERLAVELQVDVHEGEGAEENEQPGGDAADDGHGERGDPGRPRGFDGEFDAERQTGGAGEREQPLDPVGGAPGPDVGMRGVAMRDVGKRGAFVVGVVPHIHEVTQVSLRRYLVAQGDCSARAASGPRGAAGGAPSLRGGADGRLEQPAFRVGQGGRRETTRTTAEENRHGAEGRRLGCGARADAAQGLRGHGAGRAVQDEGAVRGAARRRGCGRRPVRSGCSRGRRSSLPRG